MNVPLWIRPLFVLAAAYDGLLGLLFLVAPRFLFDQYGVPPPNHPAYVQFPAALLIVFALMFVNIARDPLPNRPLIPYGVLLKVAYCGVAGWYWLRTGIPWFWKPFAVIDLIMAVLFAWAYAALEAASTAEPTIRPHAKEVES
ncbi:MAG: hypothetical protein CHACPFDD_01864 [Phycisphaerae bacterium]|nr:hypothetical protein [Phycisphaerae bacterium]